MASILSVLRAHDILAVIDKDKHSYLWQLIDDVSQYHTSKTVRQYKGTMRPHVQLKDRHILRKDMFLPVTTGRVSQPGPDFQSIPRTTPRVVDRPTLPSGDYSSSEQRIIQYHLAPYPTSALIKEILRREEGK